MDHRWPWRQLRTIERGWCGGAHPAAAEATNAPRDSPSCVPMQLVQLILPLVLVQRIPLLVLFSHPVACARLALLLMQLTLPRPWRCVQVRSVGVTACGAGIDALQAAAAAAAAASPVDIPVLQTAAHSPCPAADCGTQSMPCCRLRHTVHDLLPTAAHSP